MASKSRAGVETLRARQGRTWLSLQYQRDTALRSLEAMAGTRPPADPEATGAHRSFAGLMAALRDALPDPRARLGFDQRLRDLVPDPTRPGQVELRRLISSLRRAQRWGGADLDKGLVRLWEHDHPRELPPTPENLQALIRLADEAARTAPRVADEAFEPTTPPPGMDQPPVRRPRVRPWTYFRRLVRRWNI